MGRSLGRWILGLLLAGPAVSPLPAQEQAEPEPAPAGKPVGAELRRIVVISDLHIGLGRKGGTTKDPETGKERVCRDEAGWLETEDFRWPCALAGFLKRVSSDGDRQVDLVIAGDFLELWQRPADIPCEGHPKDPENYGCTVEEMEEMVRRVLAAHPDEVQALAKFAAEGTNCLHVVPGNHDAALVEDGPWKILEEALKAGGGCVRRPEGGRWTSPSGKIVVEHGHEIGEDVNRFKAWPAITKPFPHPKTGEPTLYFERSWGESAVQAIFDAEEQAFPLIDNLSPHSAGVRYRLAEQDLKSSLGDVGRFLRFHLLETSWRQKLQTLGANEDPAKHRSAAEGRKLGHQLYLAALEPKDPFAQKLASAGGPWEALRLQLDEDIKKLPDGDTEALTDDEVLALCHLAAARGHERICTPPTLGKLAESVFFSRPVVVRGHVEELWGQNKSLKTFVYGHTHSFELPWDAWMAQSVRVGVLNSGAFQRVIDDARFKDLYRKKELTPARAMAEVPLEELPPCYTAVQIDWKGYRPEAQLRAWYMPEDGTGRFVDPCDPDLCPSVGHGC